MIDGSCSGLSASRLRFSAVTVLTAVAWLSFSPAQPDLAVLDPELDEIVAMAIELPAE